MPGILTKRQREVLDFIRYYIEKEGIAPTIRETAQHFRFASPLSVQIHINALIKKGYLTKSPLKTRGLKIIGLSAPSGRRLPLLGKVRAGKPIIALEEPEAHITVDTNLFKHKDAFALRITGDSMVDAGILENDIVIIKPEKEPANGSIAVVLIHDEVTVKRFYKEHDKARLVPENKAMLPAILKISEIQILGVVIGVIRKL